MNPKRINDIIEFFGPAAKHVLDMKGIVPEHKGPYRQVFTLQDFNIFDDIFGVVSKVYKEDPSVVDLPITDNPVKVQTIEEIYRMPLCALNAGQRTFYAYRPSFKTLPWDVGQSRFGALIQCRLIYLSIVDKLGAVATDQARLLGKMSEYINSGLPSNLDFIQISVLGKRLSGRFSSGINLHAPKDIQPIDHDSITFFRVIQTLKGKESECYITINALAEYSRFVVEQEPFVASLEKKILEKIHEFTGSDDDLGFSLRLK